MICVRLAATTRGAPRNLAPTSLPLRHTTWQLASRPSTSTMSSNVSGMPTELSMRRRAPVSDRSRSVQATVICRSLEAAIADFRTRRRADVRPSSGAVLTSVLPIALNGTTEPPVLHKVVNLLLAICACQSSYGDIKHAANAAALRRAFFGSRLTIDGLRRARSAYIQISRPQQQLERGADLQ